MWDYHTNIFINGLKGNDEVKCDKLKRKRKLYASESFKIIYNGCHFVT